MNDHASDWQRLQQEFLAQWLGGAATRSWQQPFQNLFTPAGAATPGPESQAPWQAFKVFADLLGEQAVQLRAGRKRKLDVAAALKALLENLVRGIDAAIAVQALTAGDKAMGTLPSGIVQAFAGWPALGLTREWQGRVQRCWQAMAAEREAGEHLRTLQWRTLRAGCERCSRALSAPGPAVTSLRGLYDFLVDEVEAAWRETAMTDEYARAFGASVNAALALRSALRDCVQPLTGLLELAGRAELDGIERRLRALEETRPGAPRIMTAAVPTARTPVPAAAKPTVAPVTQAPATPRPPRRRREVPAPPIKPIRKAPAKRAEFDIASVLPRGDHKD